VKRQDPDDIAAINAEVAAPPVVPGNPAFAPSRTLWYAQYDLDNLTLAVKFYLGERPDPADAKKAVLEYSPIKAFQLKK